MRDFTDSIKFFVVRKNLEINNGRICCEICGKELKSIDESHFDHVLPYAKGGKSTKENCQILCSSCNLKKNDKELNDFLLDEKAKEFLKGSTVSESETKKNALDKELGYIDNSSRELTKEKFDLLVGDFIGKKGAINIVDFKREYNNLPSIKKVYEFYGDFSTLRRAFNLKEKTVWNRTSIKEALKNYVKEHGNVFEKDLKASNDMPSYPCIIKYYPEYSGLNELKRDMLKLNVRRQWTLENAIEAGKEFVKENGIVTLKDMKIENNLPSSEVVYRYFGNMEEFQKAVGSKISKRNVLITKSDIEKITKNFFTDRSKKFETREEFFNEFPISPSVIYKNYGSFDTFCEKYGIIIKRTRKAKFTKKEVDDIVLNYIKAGNPIPKSAKELSVFGLPTREVIMRYYESWKEPFVLFSKLCEKIN